MNVTDHTVLDIELIHGAQSFKFHMEYETWRTVLDIEMVHDAWSFKFDMEWDMTYGVRHWDGDA